MGAPDPERMGQFTDLLGTSTVDLELAARSGDRAAVAAASQQLGQKLIDFHVAEIKTAAERVADQQWEVFNRTQTEWKKAFAEDPEIGGNRIETTLAECGSIIEQFGGKVDPQTGMANPEQVAELRKVLSATGAGNHPAVIRWVHNVARALGEGRPVPAPRPAPQQMSRAERRYRGGNGAATPASG